MRLYIWTPERCVYMTRVQFRTRRQCTVHAEPRWPIPFTAWLPWPTIYKRRRNSADRDCIVAIITLSKTIPAHIRLRRFLFRIISATLGPKRMVLVPRELPRCWRSSWSPTMASQCRVTHQHDNSNSLFQQTQKPIAKTNPLDRPQLHRRIRKRLQPSLRMSLWQSSRDPRTHHLWMPHYTPFRSPVIPIFLTSRSRPTIAPAVPYIIISGDPSLPTTGKA